MATSSITKEFYIKDQKVYDNLKKELDKEVTKRQPSETLALKRGRKKLATFVFR